MSRDQHDQSDIGASDGLEIISAIGHELRNIVGAVVHQIELLADGEMSEPMQARSRAAVVDSAHELHLFIDALTDLERLERGDTDVHLAPADLVELLESVSRDHARENAGGEATASGVVIESSGSPVVFIDMATMRRVVVMIVAESITRLSEPLAVVSATEDHVDLTFRSAGAQPRRHREVRIDDGLLLWIAARLARQSNVDLQTSSTGSSLHLRLRRVRG